MRHLLEDFPRNFLHGSVTRAIAVPLVLAAAIPALAQDEPTDEGAESSGESAQPAVDGDSTETEGSAPSTDQSQSSQSNVESEESTESNDQVDGSAEAELTETVVDAEDPTPATVSPPSAPEPIAPDPPEPVQATTIPAENPYLDTRAPTTSKLDVPIQDLPRSIAVVPREVLEDQGATTFEDSYRNVSGVYESGNTLNARSAVLPVIRGFEAPLILRNGLRATGVGTIDFFNIETVEVLKGPGAIEFGALEPGGIVNYTTKQPLDTPAYEVNQRFGSWNFYRSTLDAGGPANPEGSVLYRFNTVYQNSGSFRDFVDLERFGIAPTVSLRIDDRTDLALDFSYVRESVPYDSGVPFGFDDEPLVPIDTFFGDPSLEGRTLEDTFVGATLEHRGDVFTWRSRFQYHRTDARNEGIRNREVLGAPGAELLETRYQNLLEVNQEYQFITDLSANFETGFIEHDLAVGVDLIRKEEDAERFRQTLPAVPISANPGVSFMPPVGLKRTPNRSTTLGWAALYANDQISLLEDGRLKVLLGGRFDYTDTETTIPDRTSNTESDFTGRVGVLYELTDWLSPYGNITESFQAQNPGTIDSTGAPLAPETGIQYEAGVKLHFFEDRLQATLAAFEIEKQDVALFDLPNFLATGDVAFLPGVDQGSRGFELDVQGQITDRLSVIGNYAFIDTEVLANATDPTEVGDPLGGVPEHSVRLWLAHEFACRDLAGNLGVGGGLRFESDRRANFDDTELQDFAVFDAGLWYEKELRQDRIFNARISLQNIGDREYYPRASDQSIVHPGAPFGIFGSVGLEF